MPSPSDDVIRIAKRSILDTFGCAFGGYSAAPSRIAINLAKDVSSKHAATVLFTGTKTSPDLAVFANGVMIRTPDFNDAFVSLTHGAGHPSDTLAALLAAAELGGRSGRDLVAATVVAYEMFARMADVFDYLGNGIDHSTITGIAAVIGAGRLMGLTVDQMVHAIGITVGGNTATRQGRADTLSNWKAYAAADACRKAIFAVQLAKSGMTGPGSVFEGRYGFFKVMGKKGRPRRSRPVGPSGIVPMESSLSLFVWSKDRIVPVRVTDFSITEEAFDPALNPIRAKVSPRDARAKRDHLGFQHKGAACLGLFAEQRAIGQ